MTEITHITVLVENSVHRAGLKGEHGWSCLVEKGGRRVLFDTGQTDLLLDNAQVLGCSLENLDAIVLSHGHYDHTGGLEAVCRLSPTAKVFAHPAALAPKFSVNPDATARYIGMSEASRRLLEQAESRLKLTIAPQEVVPGLFVTGAIPRQTDFEDVGGPFFLEASGQQPDPLLDDQAVFCETTSGLVVLLGCAHAGVVNTLTHIAHLTGGKPVHAVWGGMHLGLASERRLAETVTYLRKADLACLMPAHCTGVAATTRLLTEFPGRCRSAATGIKFSFPL